MKGVYVVIYKGRVFAVIECPNEEMSDTEIFCEWLKSQGHEVDPFLEQLRGGTIRFEYSPVTPWKSIEWANTALSDQSPWGN